MSNDKTKTEKFVLIDTNIYISFCFYDLDIENNGVLDELKRLLTANKFKLFLPEVVKIEFEKRFNEKIQILEDDFSKLIENISKNNVIGGKKAKENLIASIKETRLQTIEEIEKFKKTIHSIFNHKNTIQEGLELNHELLVIGYKMFLAGKKPYKKLEKDQYGYTNIQPDCLIIASVARYLKDKDSYELYFSTGNKNDFAKNPSVKENDKLQIATDIAEQFFNIEYYHDPLKMLKKNFDAKYTKETIKKFEKSAERLFTAQSNGTIALGMQSTYTPMTSSSTISAYNPSIFVNGVASSSTFRPSSLRSCKKCSRDYIYHPNLTLTIDDGLCDNCRNNQFGTRMFI